MHAKGITNYGETKIASAVGTSLALGKDGHLTYLVDGSQVVTAYWDSDAKSVEKSVMLELDLSAGEIATDLFVFDDVVAVRVESGEFKFFTIPLVAGQVSLEIPFAAPPTNATNETSSNQFTDFSSIVAFGMHQHTNSEGVRIYELYAALPQSLIKVSFNHDFYSDEIKHVAEVKEATSQAEYFDGTLVRAAVTHKEFIVSCADCGFPRIVFFDHSLEQVFLKKLNPSQTNAYELAYHE